MARGLEESALGAEGQTRTQGTAGKGSHGGGSGQHGWSTEHTGISRTARRLHLLFSLCFLWLVFPARRCPSILGTAAAELS